MLTNNYSASPVIKRTLAKMEDGNKSRKVVILGGGIMGLGTAFHLSQRGYANITVLEKGPEVAKEASYINGSMLCPSMCATWASFKLLAKNKAELRRIGLTMDALLDHKFWRWGMWFTFNCFWPGKVERNHTAQRELGLYSLQCMEALEAKFGSKLEFNKTATNTLRLYYSEEDLRDFMQSSQAKFWQDHGRPFKVIKPEKVRKELPCLGFEHPSNKELVGGVINDPGIDSSGDIHMFCRNLLKLCLDNGVKIKTNCGVKEILIDAAPSGKKTVSGFLCEDNSVEKGDIYVLATGIMSNPIGRSIGINLPIYPLKGNVITAQVTESLGMNVYSPDHGSLICPLRPNIGRISGGVEAVGYNWKFDTSGCPKILENTIKTFKPGFLEETKAEFFAACRPVCADDIPIIGQTLIPNLFAITGHGSKGWTLSFGSVELLADIIDGKSTKIDCKPYSPLRFHPIRRLFANYSWGL